MVKSRRVDVVPARNLRASVGIGNGTVGRGEGQLLSSATTYNRHSWDDGEKLTLMAGRDPFPQVATRKAGKTVGLGYMIDEDDD